VAEVGVATRAVDFGAFHEKFAVYAFTDGLWSDGLIE
jgi:hypothetical protein